MKAITQRLQQLRFSRDRISQREVSQKIRMPLQRYWEIENGYRQPSEDEVKAIAKVLRVTPTEIDPSYDASKEAVS